MTDAYPALWGGFECSVVRVGADYRNQLVETGHDIREGDMALAKSLGISALRYPLLWETVSPASADALDWTWHDRRLVSARVNGLTPIAGLLHHGSGPRFTNLLDPDFPRLFAEYAGKVARRYPWIDHYTPINEPLTTARFSGLYGLWYPHGRGYRQFLSALVNQCLGIHLAMRAIREVNPGAQLIQTEDVSKIFSTDEVAFQARHENGRRWLSLDLLCGRVTPGHDWHAELLAHGVNEQSLRTLAECPSTPDIVGLNYYLTSDRFLDHRVDLYPNEIPGGNGRQTYVDVSASRAHIPTEELGWLPRLRETWDRYHIPLALTEVHNGAPIEEQLRWLAESWTAARQARDLGIDVRAVTAWALMGCVDWNSLLTRRAGHYEPGVFDIRNGPQATSLAAALRSISLHGTFDHPVLDRPGWWRRPDRYHLRSSREPAELVRGRSIGVVGGDVEITSAFMERAAARAIDCARLPATPGYCEPRVWAIVEISSGSYGSHAWAETARVSGIIFRPHIGAFSFGRNKFEEADDLLDAVIGDWMEYDAARAASHTA